MDSAFTFSMQIGGVMAEEQCCAEGADVWQPDVPEGVGVRADRLPRTVGVLVVPMHLCELPWQVT